MHAGGPQKPQEGVVLQKRVSKAGSWMDLTEARPAQEDLDHIQKSDGLQPATHEETAADLILTLNSWTWNHTIPLHDKIGPPYARTATCWPATAATGAVHLDWTPTQQNDKYTFVHNVSHREAVTEAEEPQQPTAQPTSPAHQQWTLLGQLAHARTLAEHSIRPYMDVTYVEGMLRGWTKCEMEVPEGHTGPPDTTPQAT